MSTVILFTGSYPYDVAVEHTFLDPEMAYLQKSFDRVIVIPANLAGKRRSLPAGVELEEGYARDWQSYFHPLKALLQVFCLPLFWQELRRHSNLILKPAVIKKMAWVLANASFTSQWVKNFIGSQNIDLSSTVFYTYWLDHITLGIGLAKTDFPGIKLCSRAHNYDIYEERKSPPYIPFRPLCLKNLDRLVLISGNGRDYMALRYPWFEEKCITSRLGVKDPGFTTQPSQDGVTRIVSCSMLVPFKRVDLLFEGLKVLAEKHSEKKFEWTHLGDGPLMEKMRSKIDQSPENLTCHLAGFLPNEHVLSFYRNHPVDVFINVSEIEGIPVSMMEAQSCGIPVVATAVGGSPEIVSDNNGSLLPPDPDAEAIANALWGIVRDFHLNVEKRNSSKLSWQNKYNSDINFPEFISVLKSIVEQ